MFKKILTLLKNNKAFSNLELAIGALILITVISIGLELSNMAVQHNTVSTNLNYIARIVEQQGGVSNSAPSYFRGNYVKSETIYRNIKTSMDDIGIPENEWKLTISDGSSERVFSSSFNYNNYAYGTRLTVSLTYEHEWPLISHFIPNLNKIERTLSREVITTNFPRENDSIEYN